VLFLTAKCDEIDRIVGIEIGADDYMGKPFNPRELLARAGAILRRVHSLPPQQAATAAPRLQFGDWVLDTVRRELINPEGVGIALSTGEYKLLHALLERPKIVLKREDLLDITCGRDAQPFDRAIDNAVMRLRRKLEEDPRNPRIIKTVWGGGYVLAAEPVALS
jgi:two-component system OmpR family response regulator